jgi:Protein of unknown function (DUF2490)
MYKIVIVFVIFFIPGTLWAQHKVTHTNMLWFNYNNNIALNKKWNIISDVQIRTREWTSHWSQFALRGGAAYKLNNKFTAAGGFTWFGNVRYFNDEPTVANEWRPWEEIAFQTGIGKNLLIQRIRLEQRFLQIVVLGKKTMEYEDRQRFRYRMEFGFPLTNKKMEIHLGNEVMVNLNYISDNRFFDQNRTFAFINYKISPSLFFQFQYVKIFQWQGLIKVMDDQNVFRFSIHQQINLPAHKNI